MLIYKLFMVLMYYETPVKRNYRK